MNTHTSITTDCGRVIQNSQGDTIHFIQNINRLSLIDVHMLYRQYFFTHNTDVKEFSNTYEISEQRANNIVLHAEKMEHIFHSFKHAQALLNKDEK